MKIALVVGTVVSTIQHAALDGRKLLVCDILTERGKAQGGYLIAVDTVGAGVGETVLLVDEGNSARQVMDRSDAPVRTVIVGIIDQVELSAQPD